MSIKHASYFIAIVFVSFLTSCIKGSHLYVIPGVRIGNYPEWVGSSDGKRRSSDNMWSSASSWLSWKNEPHNIKTVLPSTFKRDNFNGMFRIIDNGQYIIIEFDDGVVGCFLYIWIAEAPREASTYSVPQENDKEFIYNGFAKYYYENNHEDKNTELKSQSKYVYIGENDSTYSYRYIFTINDMEIFNVIITAYKESAYAKNIVPGWLPDTQFYNSEEDAKEGSPALYDITFIGLKDSPESEFYNIITSYGDLYAVGEVYDLLLFFHGGVEQVVLDNTQKLVKYELRGTPSNGRKYVELKLVSENSVKFSWLDAGSKLINEQVTWLYIDD